MRTEINKEIYEYDVIILDRLFLSILAMQGRNEKDIELINFIKKIIIKEKNQFLTFYMDTNPEECKCRLANKSSCDRIEEKGVKFHNIVYNRYILTKIRFYKK